MKFTKEVAHIIVNMKDGESYKHTHTQYNLSVNKLVNYLMRLINNGSVMIDLDDSFIDPKEVESFEITNYDELYALELERNSEDHEDNESEE